MYTPGQCWIRKPTIKQYIRVFDTTRRYGSSHVALDRCEERGKARIIKVAVRVIRHEGDWAGEEGKGQVGSEDRGSHERSRGVGECFVQQIETQT